MRIKGFRARATLHGQITRPIFGQATLPAEFDRLRPSEKSAPWRSKRVVLPMMIALSMAATLLTPAFSVAPAQAATVVGTAGLFVPVQGRLVDSRVGTGISNAPLAPMTPRAVQVTGVAGLPEDGVSAVLVTVTAVAPTAGGQMSAGPSDGAMAGVMRYDASPYTSNSAVVMVSAQGLINLQATTTTNVMVDVQGYYTVGNGVTAAGGYSPVTQSRIVDTINGVGLAKAKLVGGSTSTIQVTGKAGVPAGAAAVFVNFQINNTTTVAGYINPYAASATSRPGVSLNFDASPSTSIGAIVPLAADGTIKMYVSAGNTIDLLLDVEGYFTPGGSSSSAGVFTPAVAKIYDTRSAVHVAPGATVTIPIGGTNDIPTVANGLSAITANLTVVDTGTAGGYARAYASGTTEPTNVGTLTFSPATEGTYTTNLATIPVGADNAIKIHNVSTDTVDYILDLNGWYTKMPTIQFSCPSTMVSESWTWESAPQTVNCKLKATNPYASPLVISASYDDESYAPYTVQGKSSLDQDIPVDIKGGNHTLSGQTDTPAGEPVVATYDFTVGDWSTSQWMTSIPDGTTTDLKPVLDYSPLYGEFPETGNITFNVTTNPDGRSNSVKTSTSAAQSLDIPAGVLSPGTKYYWTAFATGSTPGGTVNRTVQSAVYSFTTSRKYTSSNEPTTQINFDMSNDNTYVDAFASILSTNGAQATEEFFNQAAKDPADISLPGVGAQTDEVKKQVFEASAEAAANNSPVQESDLPPEVQTPAQSSPSISTFSLASSQVRGAAIGYRYAWRYDQGRADHYTCNWIYCRVTGWVTYKVTTDPGQYASKNTYNVTFWGRDFRQVNFNSSIYAAGHEVSYRHWIAFLKGGAQVTFNRHKSSLNKSFQAYYEINFIWTKGNIADRFKTGKSGACKNQVLGAYACKF